MKNVTVMFISAAIALSTFAQSEEIDGVVWRYKLTSDEFGVVLTGNSTSDLSAIPRSTKGVVVLPSWIGDCPVVEIDQDAFYGCKYLTDIDVTDDNLYFTSIGGVVYDYDVTVLVRCPQGKVSVSIPYGVTEIAAGAFAGCTKLAQIELPETLRHIRGDAFCGCTELKKMEIPESVVAIDAGAFSGCASLTNVTFHGNSPSVMSFIRLQMNMCDEFGQPLYYVRRNVTLDNSVGESSSSCSLMDELVPRDYSSSKTRIYETGEDGIVWTERITDCASEYAASEIEKSCFYDTNLNFDQSKCSDNCFDGIISNYHWAAIYDFAGYSSTHAPRTSPYLVTYADINSSGWSSSQAGATPEYWCGRPIRFFGEGQAEQGAEDKGFTSGNQNVTLTVTNIVVHYVFNSIPSSLAVPVSNSVGFVNIITEVASSGAVSVPTEWKTNYPQFETKFGTDFGKALAMKTGKKDGAGNDMFVWQDFVAGTDPTDENDQFTASITIVDGVPVISYTPELTAEQAALRVYKTYGKMKLTDTAWTDITAKTSEERAAYNFFKVSVEMK